MAFNILKTAITSTSVLVSLDPTFHIEVDSSKLYNSHKTTRRQLVKLQRSSNYKYLQTLSLQNSEQTQS